MTFGRPAAKLTPVPMEDLVLPPELTGVQGTNRVSGASSFTPQDDLDAIKAWLERYKEKRATERTYRKEAERLLLWAVCERGKSLSSLDHADLSAY